MANIKLTGGNTWDTSGVYDVTEQKTQDQVNADIKEDVSDLKSAITQNTKNINTAKPKNVVIQNNGVIVDWPQTSSFGYGTPVKIQCKSSTEYTFTIVGVVTELTSFNFSGDCAFYQEDGTLIQKSTKVAPLDGKNASFTVTTTSATKYLAVDFYYGATTVSADENTCIQIEEGSSFTGYVPPITAVDYTAREDISNLDSVTIKDADVLTVDGLNLFDKTTAIIGKEIYSDGTAATESKSACTDYIYVHGHSLLYIKNLPSYASGLNRFYRFYGENKAYIDHGALAIDYRLADYVMQIPSDAYYVRFSIYQRATTAPLSFDNLMVSYFDVPFEPFTKYFNGIDNLEIPFEIANVIKPTHGMKGLYFGDSITETASYNNDGSNYTEGIRMNWPTYANSYLELGSFKNYGYSGAAYKLRDGVEFKQTISNQISVAMADSNNDDCDIIVCSAGTNDGGSSIGSYDVAMGKATLNDLDKSNLYEALRFCFWTLRSKYKNAVCFAALPIQRASNEQPTDMLEAIRKMAQRYDFIIIDAYGESGIVRENEVDNGEGNDLADGLHPNTQGKVKMGELYADVIIRQFLYKTDMLKLN